MSCAWLMYEAILSHLPARQLEAGEQLTMHQITILKTARVRLQLNWGPGRVPHHPTAAREDFLGAGLSRPTLFPQAERDGCRLRSRAAEPGSGGITFSPTPLWKRQACGREGSMRDQARARTGLTGALFGTKVGDQNPGRSTHVGDSCLSPQVTMTPRAGCSGWL